MNFLEVPIEHYEKYRSLFDHEYCPRAFVDSAFTHKMYPLKVNDEENPTAAYIDYKFAVVYVGDVESLTKEDVLSILPEGVAVAGDSKLWKAKMLEFFEGKIVERRRTRMSHHKLELDDLELLKKTLPEGYHLERVDKKTAENLPEMLFVHIPILYGSVDNFIEKSIGFCVKKGDETVSMASSSLPYTRLLEMQVATVDSPEYRRKGFGTAVSIALIEYCLKNNVEPIWEAANDRSVDMALKLGYTDPEDIYYYYWRNE